MRRGRPAQLSTDKSSAQPSPSPRRAVANDPFAALDSSKATDTNEVDDISKRFPSLDQFSLFHESGGKFAFEQKPQNSSQPRDLSQRVTEALADEAFAIAPTSKAEDAPRSKSVPDLISKMNAGTQTDSPKDTKASPMKSTVVSTGTMTSPRTSLDDRPPESARPIWRVPQSDNRSSSQPRTSSLSSRDLPEKILSVRSRPSLAEHRSKSQTTTLAALKTPLSARPSLETRRTPSTEFEDPLSRTRSDTVRSRPLSATFDSATRFLHARSPSQSKLNSEEPYPPSPQRESGNSDGEASRISSNVDFLRAMEDEEPSKRKEKRQSSGTKSGKRTSLPSISLSGTKSLLAGRFGDAFKRFESNNTSDDQDEALNRNLTPITGSIATDDRSDDGQVLEETEEMPPEMRRELERRRLSQEERRVAEAAAAYKQRVADSNTGGGRPRDTSRAALIQNKVQSLLDESNKPSPPKTAAGYGRYTNSPQPDQDMVSPTTVITNEPSRKLFQPPPLSRTAPPASRAPVPSPTIRPTAPPKPQVLRTGGSIPSPTVVAKPPHLSNRQPQAQAVPSLAKAKTAPISPEDWEANFSKRYPSLAGLEMVETEIDAGGRIVRDV